VTHVVSVLQSALSFVVVLGILVFVHEFGHFIVAKAFGIGVPVFSLGFGPRLGGFKRKETDYRISAVPLGGYVRLAGDEADDARTGGPDEFLSRPRWQRFLVFVAGATFNVVLAILVMTLIFSVWGKEEVQPLAAPPVVAEILPGSTAEAAGLNVGDKILAIGGKDARQPETQGEQIFLSPDQTKSILVEREGRTLTLSMKTGQDPSYHLGDPGWRLFNDGLGPPLIDTVMGGSAAEAAGLARGDKLIAIDGHPAEGELQVRAMLEKSAGRSVTVRIERGGQVRDVAVTPRDDGGKGRIGVLFTDGNRVRRKLPPVAAFGASIDWARTVTGTVFMTLGKLFRGEISVRAFSGPLEIARVSRAAAQTLDTFLAWLAFISLQLGVFNLLPIPVLDGGHILLLGIEGTIRRDIPDRVKERVTMVGLVALLVFFVVVFYFDVDKLRRLFSS
jgi:regulator of sigma E protease